MPIVIKKKAQVDASNIASAQPEAAPAAMQLPTSCHDAPGPAGNDNSQQQSLSAPAPEQPENLMGDLSSDDGLLDPETGEPLASKGCLEEVDESGRPGEVDDAPMDGAGCDEPELTEDYIAHAFIDHYGPELRFDHDVGSWYEWNGAHWRKDETRATFDKVRVHCRTLRGLGRMMSSRRAIESIRLWRLVTLASW